MAHSNDGIVLAVIVSALAAIFLAALMLRRAAMPLGERIDAMLPQTQCGQCGYAGCLPYAQAIARGETAINRCPPGGDNVIRKLARITGKDYLTLDTDCGIHKPRQVALIDEQRCIGCRLCIQACPVDAIVGAPKLMHTVISPECTGCELCLPPCPVDCITLEPAPGPVLAVLLGETRNAADRARSRFEARNRRLERNKREHTERMAAKAAAKRASAERTTDPAAYRKWAIVEAAIERARVKLAAIT